MGDLELDPWVGKSLWRGERLPILVFWPGILEHDTWGQRSLVILLLFNIIITKRRSNLVCSTTTDEGSSHSSAWSSCISLLWRHYWYQWVGETQCSSATITLVIGRRRLRCVSSIVTLNLVMLIRILTSMEWLIIHYSHFSGFEYSWNTGKASYNLFLKFLKKKTSSRLLNVLFLLYLYY